MTANPTTPDPREALRELVRYVERNTCLHEETHRAGFIWTICDGCGRKWADDEGGFQPDDEPAELVAARAALATPSARQGGEVDGPLHMLIDYADMADETGYGTVSSSIVRDLVQQALSARPAAGDGEPVEWRYRYKHPLPNGGRSKWRLCDGPNEAQELRERGSYDVQPLYTAPPAREGVPEGMVLVPVEPPFPKQYIATGTRTENGVSTAVYLHYSEEGGGWFQWGTSKAAAKQFKTAKAATDAAKGAPGPWFHMPEKSTIKTEAVESPKAKQYRAILNAALSRPEPAGRVEALVKSMRALVAMWDDYRAIQDSEEGGSGYSDAYYSFVKGHHADWESAKHLLTLAAHAPQEGA